MMSEPRTQHPFHMYDAIVAQPEAFAWTVERNEVEIERLAPELASCRRLFLVGIGTSHHAALVGEHLMREYGGGVDVWPMHSFDFALYGPHLAPGDGVVAVSHRGTKRFTARALEKAREAGCRTVVISGEGGAPDSAAGVVLRTVAQERSSAHTISYACAISVLAALAARVGHHRTGKHLLEEGLLRSELPAVLQAGLETEEDIAALAEEHLGSRRIWFLGGGPGAVTAREAALKVKETSYLQAEGMSTEEMLHGPFQCVEDEDLFVLIVPAGASQERVFDLARAVREVGAPYLVVEDGTPRSLRQDAAGRIVLPEVPEPFSALSCLVPLQLFAYHLALAWGTNPDSFRAEDPRFARFQKLVDL